MEWLHDMQRATQPARRAAALFLHGPGAVAAATANPDELLLAYRDRLRRFANLRRDPSAIVVATSRSR